MKALSIMQPWPWLIVNGYKDVENRSWSATHRGLTQIHAGKKVDWEAVDDLRNGRHPVTGKPLPFLFRLPDTLETGGIVGEADIVDCVASSDSSWFVGPFGFLMRNARPLPFRPLRGMLGFFEVPPAPEAG